MASHIPTDIASAIESAVNAPGISDRISAEVCLRTCWSMQPDKNGVKEFFGHDCHARMKRQRTKTKPFQYRWKIELWALKKP